MKLAPRSTLLLIASLAAGCAGREASVKTGGPWYGPTDRLDVVLAKINANSGRISTLNGNGLFEATFRDGGKERFLNGSIDLLHTKPNQLRLRAKKFLGLTEILVFDLGANDDVYWFHVPEADSLWYGRVESASRATSAVPISPTLIADVLGVATLGTDLLAQPVPTMRFNPDYDTYMLTWSQPMEDRWVTLREVWYDRRTLEPRLIWLFDRNGRVQVRAELKDFAPLDGDDANAPRTARIYNLLFPETRSLLKINLKDVRAYRGGSPNRLTYRFAPDRVAAEKKIDLDATP